jgi:hypothetical protein
MVSSLINDAQMAPGGAHPVPIEGADLPRRLFHCRLDDQPDHLVPRRYLRYWERECPADRPLFINPDCSFASPQELPFPVGDREPLGDSFALNAKMVWIHDPVRRAMLPFWLGPQMDAILEGCKGGDRVSSRLGADARWILETAGVLVSGSDLALRGKRWRDALSGCAAEFEAHRYTPIGSLIHPFHLSALRRYYRHLIRQGQVKLGDSQSPLRYATQNEPVARFFHHQLTEVVSSVVEEAVKPSYVYLGSYQGGAELEVHIDREQCEFSISLCIDYSPEPKRHTPWPLHLHTASGKTTVFQGIGDGLIYSGRELPHSRDRLSPGNTSTSLFFHYVREGFTGRLT